ncbi:DNA ligase D [Hydrocarboniclastica marina]|uniref:DNA ligase (ATP) n=1 Tax=Hydrocarboniclastica marina TaxID=2259620 RepID=A0A4P7XH66_9ALTE|nr:DNA ligase D [Hydrocarboniclastica marina]QCF25794.1 DNA ligase D [Hydrocarboniclastica marina]
MSDALEEYRRKRNFSVTAEPAGSRVRQKKSKGSPAQGLKFVIQKHAARRLHYDFRLELEGTLKSWAVPKGPSLDPKSRRLAVQVEDHPLEYGLFEGNIAEGGYGAGDMIVWDQGIWIPADKDPVAAFRKGKLKFELEGAKLSGSWNLVRTGMSGSKQQWFLIKSKDDAARSESDYDITKALPDSVLSGQPLPSGSQSPSKKKPARGRQTNEQPATRARNVSRGSGGTQGTKTGLDGAREAPIPELQKPQLATLADSVPSGDGWRYEIKFDGYRILTRIDQGEVRLFTRNGHDWTGRMPRQTEALSGLPLESAWLDGEIVVPDDKGLPDFQALQNAFNTGASSGILYYLFDLTYLNGMDLRQVPLEQRRSALGQIIDQSDSDLLRFSAEFEETGEAMLNSACELQMEGLIAKRIGSRYTARRSKDWLKLKCSNRQEFVVVGYTEPKNSRSHFGALLLGLHDEPGGNLRYAGKVGTGFNATTLKSVFARIKPLEVGKPAVADPPTGADARGAHWLEPSLLAEVAFAQMTREGVVRHAVFHGLREDKTVRDIVREKPKPTPAPRARKAKDVAPSNQADANGNGVKISHPERIIDPASGTTKQQLADYYETVSPWVLSVLKDRPVAIVRAPEGINGELFFQKHGDKLNIPAMKFLDKHFSGQPAMVVNNAKALVGAVQMNTIEFHAWNATSHDLEHPDCFVLDLDPDPSLPWQRMIEATQLTLTVLEELGLTAFLKTSGGKGIHIVVPLSLQDSWDSVKTFSRAIVRHMAKLLPDRFTAVSGPRNRVGRIFIDYLRNSNGATTIAAYSARARPGMAVSVPIGRDELEKLTGADAWTVHNLPERLDSLKQNPWQGYASVEQVITDEMRSRLGLN